MKHWFYFTVLWPVILVGHTATMFAQIVGNTAPRGKLDGFIFNESTLYPGTTRKVTVFIPAQYDGTRPACVYVQQDGIRPGEEKGLEKLIAAKEMPVAVGVFVEPGQNLAPAMDASPRRNRSLEYDGMGDTYVRFLLEEVLPSVAKRYQLNLSTNGSDRCIAGASSGGISAFNAAWERPDAFSRVYANSASFVAFRGGNEFPTLVRKFEAKPIRVYLTTATNDMENCAGNWYLADSEMARALQFSGYDFMFRVIDGGHTAGWNSCFPEAMRFLWRDWPEPVHTGRGAPRVRDILLPGEEWQLAAEGFKETRGPACNSHGVVFFADPPQSKIFRVDVDGNVSVFASDTGHANGLSCGANGDLYAISHMTGEVTRYESTGNHGVLVSGIPGEAILASANGNLFITSNGNPPQERGELWLIKNAHAKLLDSNLKYATGLAMRPDQWLLSVTDASSKWIYSFEIATGDTVTNRERFFCLHVPDWDDNAGAQSLCCQRSLKTSHEGSNENQPL